MNDVETLFTLVDIGKLMRRFRHAALNPNEYTRVVLFEYDYTSKYDVDRYNIPSILERMPLAGDERLIHSVVTSPEFRDHFQQFLMNFADILLNPDGYRVDHEKHGFVMITRHKIVNGVKNLNRVQYVLHMNNHAFVKNDDDHTVEIIMD